MMDRRYEVVILGATGFTGSLVVQYFIERYGVGESLKWAIAGRNEQKLRELRTELGVEGLEYLVANNNNRESLDLLTQSTKVVCTTVGPYAKYGSDLVASCVENKTHYCDLSGEVQWMRKMIDQHHQKALENKVKIVLSCGFDSIPSDLGVYFMQRMAKEKLGTYCQQIKMRVKAAKGGYSGGTVASLRNTLDEAYRDKSLFKVLNNPYGLNPEGERSGPDKKDLRKVVFDKDLQAWIAPFIMATINTKIVRRSHALQEYPYGKEFNYEEATLMGKGLKGRLKGYLLLTFLGLISAKPGSLTQKAVQYFLPEPGQGPDREARENGFFNILFVGKTKQAKVIRGKVTGDQDPGYGSTRKMLAESAICLAKDPLPATFGVITPSVAMQEHLLERLQKNAGLSFTILPDH